MMKCKRWLVVLVLVCMVLGMMPGTARAADTGELSISAVLVGNSTEPNRSWSFDITLSDAAGNPLPNERTVNGENLTGYEVKDSAGNVAGTVNLDESGHTTISMRGNETRTITSLPNGATYVVTEREADTDGYHTASSGTVGTIVEGEPSGVIFTNRRESGTVTVSKTVGGNAGDPYRPFEFVVTLTAPENRPGDRLPNPVKARLEDTREKTETEMELELSAENTVTFELTHNQSMTLLDLDEGTGYSVVETPVAGYVVRVEGDVEGVMDANATMMAAFTNTANVYEGDNDDPNVPDDPDEPDEPDESDPAPAPPSRPSRPDRDKPKELEKPVTVRVDDTIRAEEAEPVVISGTGESDIQHIVKDGTYADWIDRLDLPQYAIDLYTVLCIGGDNDTLYDLLIKDEYFNLSGGSAGPSSGSAEVESVLTLVSEMDRPLANGGIFTEKHFTDSSFNVIDTTSGDRAVDYASLKEGDVVRTSAFNGIFATKVTKDGNANYDAEVKAACDYVTTAFQAFDRDHPEVFWLSGKSKVRLITATIKNGNKTTKETYIFFTLADSDGFSVRDASAPSQSEIEAQIARRDAAVEKILATVTGATPDEKARDLNRWLTENNEYNTTPDLTTIGNAPHECLSALEGRIGTDGPVCDGYSRAFKVLCGRLEIPCVLVDGFARYAPEHEGEFHMWNSVQMPDGNWYGVDVTWDDPAVPGVTGAKSGYENESFLLVGSETEIAGLKFSLSHPPVNRAANGGVSFINGPTLSAAAFVPMAGIPGMPFTDMAAGSWYEEAVRYVYENRLMNGVTESTFAPGETMTRAMVWTILARIDGAEIESSTPWYASAQVWAVEKGISDGTNPGGAITRDQLAAILWRYTGSPEAAGGPERFADGGTVSSYAVEAISWAVENRILTGLEDGTIHPQGEATRAQVAAILERFSRLN